jgi:leucyl-tRNA synthetase
VAVQVNGKVRGRISVPAEAGEEEVIAAAKAVPAVMKYLDSMEIVKVVHVPGRLLSIVAKRS